MNTSFVVIWLIGTILMAWVVTDAARRRRNWLAWVMPLLFFLVFGLFFGVFGLFFLFGVIPWLIVRRRTPVAEPLGFRRGLALSLAVIPIQLLIVLVMLNIVTFLFQVVVVEGQAMAPTLADQDRLIVNKLAYRMGEPRRGDIVMLYYPLNPEKSFVKRVIAEEGDQVRIVDGRVFVNDVPMQDDFVPPEYRSHDDYGPSVINEGYYFVMGDHRNNSSDSRHWGFVPKKYIIGKVQLRWWPVSTTRSF